MTESQLREPGRLAYLGLLAASAAGTLSSNIMNAPLHIIKEDFGATESQAVLAVSAFTIAMVIFVPFMGWLCDRFGPVRIVILGLSIMVLAQLAAGLAANLETIVALRGVQGMACAVMPPGVQRGLAVLWPSKGAAAMAAWASAIAVGQALGPPVGGLITEAWGWRSVFFVQSAVCLVIVCLVALTVPRVSGREAPIHGVGMAILMLTMGACVLAVTLIGQRADPVTEAIVAIIASVGLGIYLFLATRHPERLLEPRSLWEKRFIRGTANAGTAMFIMGVCLVALPLYLGDLQLSAGPVGLIMFTMALSMVLSGQAVGRLTKRYSPRIVVEVGLLLLILAPLGLGMWTAAEHASLSVLVTVLVILLVVIGAGINAGQSVAAFGISRSSAARNSMAFGIHNTIRFMGLATGYAWAALIVPLGLPLLLYGGAAAVALVALVIVIIGGPVEPREADA